MEPTERSDDRERFVAVKIPEKIGSFHKLYTIIYPYNVTEFSYRMDSESDKEARIWMSIQTKTHDEFVDVVTAINERGNIHAIEWPRTSSPSPTCAISLAAALKMCITNERLFRLEFPERPGALKDFLDTLRYVSFGILPTPPRKTKAPSIYAGRMTPKESFDY
ncbi:hypothetical protein PsorP6_007938 [Peronosclerospora sorghi]|uniref:Uncharacterized protein n=1 Tax=Peronosclerospora sorghi TaxID=230839 RepID=A0ACC0WAG1_9STRA|nr:hypothetical protein PsorP6_007938 [Peronosclerospora sorghi]